MKAINLIIALLFVGLSSMAQQYEYDELNRVTKVTYPSNQRAYYSYDELGNRQVKSRTAITSVKKIIQNKAVSVFPTPARDELNIQFTTAEYNNVSAEIFTISGKKVLTKQLNGISENSTKLNVSNLAVGTYILRLTSDKKLISSNKIIISYW